MQKRSVFRMLLGAVLLLVALVAGPAEPASAQSGKQVWVFYMGFWGGGPSWDWQADVLKDYPLLGRYDSRDPGVAAAQIDQARGAGIDAFLVSWFGVGDSLTTTPVLNNMLDRAAERGFRVAAVVDVFNPTFNRSRDEIVASLNYLIYDRANHPGYLRYGGKPVILFAFQSRAGFSDATWLGIRNEVDPGRNTVWIAEGIDGCCLYAGAMDGMYAFNIAWADGSAARFQRERSAVISRGGSVYIPTVHPGWDEDLIAAKEGRPNPTSRRDRAGGQFLTNSWNGAVTAAGDVIMVVSWNEFMENSHIEPSQLYGTQALDVLRPLIQAWKAGAAAPAPGGQVIESNTYGLNVRSGPGTTHTRIGQIDPGATYAVLGESGGWYQISFNGQPGWVAGWLVTIRSGAAPAASAPVPTSGQILESNIAGLNVRSGPGTSNARIGQINPGTAYAILSQSGDWYQIDFNGQPGWVAGWLVTLRSGSPAPATASAPTGGRVLESTTYGLNVRSGPATSYARIGQIYPGASYAVLDENSGWYQIALTGQTGWVAGWLVTVTGGSAASPGGSPAAGQVLEATTYGLNVRTGPGTASARIGQINPGRTYPVTGARDGWYSIDFNGQTGWVAGWLVTISGASPSAAPAPIINFYASATSINPGECVTITWDVAFIREVYYMGSGVIGQGSRQECPGGTTIYYLDVVLNDGTMERREVTITVR
jgi:uncharacterized protein YgiM (DUF1202 family)